MIELGLDWSALAESASLFKVERIVQLSLEMASKIPGVNIPKFGLTPLPSSSDKYISSIIDSWEVLEDIGGPTDYRYIRTFLDTFYQRQVCLKRLTFQPTLADFNYVNLPPALRWLYPGVRLTRLVARKKDAR